MMYAIQNLRKYCFNQKKTLGTAERFLFVIFAIALAACTQPNTVQPMTSLATAKTIVFVPIVPSVFRVGQTGITILQNNLDVADDSSWDLNETAFEAVSKSVSTQYKLTLSVPENSPSSDDPDLHDILSSQLHTTASPDLFIVLSASDQSHPHVPYPNVLRSIGVSHYVGDLFGTEYPVIHTYLMLTVFDGKTLDKIYATPLMMNPQRQVDGDFVQKVLFVIGGGPKYPINSLVGFDWEDKWSAMSDAQHQLLEDKTKTLISQSLQYTIKQLKLEGPPT